MPPCHTWPISEQKLLERATASISNLALYVHFATSEWFCMIKVVRLWLHLDWDLSSIFLPFPDRLGVLMLLTSLPLSICQSVDLIERHHPSRRRKGSRAETSFYPLSINLDSFPRLQPFLCHFLAQTRPPPCWK